jgi:hypothetical protein
MQLVATAFRIASAIAGAVLALMPQFALADQLTVEQRLDEIGLKYDRDKDGDYRVVFNYARDKRSQLVYVSGTTQASGSVTIRKVFSPAAVLSKNPISGERALALLDDAFTNKMGGWELGGGVLYLAIKLPDSASADELHAAMNIAASLADDMEIKISGKRDEL